MKINFLYKPEQKLKHRHKFKDFCHIRNHPGSLVAWEKWPIFSNSKFLFFFVPFEETEGKTLFSPSSSKWRKMSFYLNTMAWSMAPRHWTMFEVMTLSTFSSKCRVLFAHVLDGQVLGGHLLLLLQGLVVVLGQRQHLLYDVLKNKKVKR